jgi:Zn-dependent protease
VNASQRPQTTVTRLTGGLLVSLMFTLPASRLFIDHKDLSPWYLLLVLPAGLLTWVIIERPIRALERRIERGLALLAGRRYRLGRVVGVEVYADWSLVALAAVLLPAAATWLEATAPVLLAYVAVLVVHEVGHAIVARSQGCEVDAIEIRAVHGFTSFSIPSRRRSAILIAWGGVIAQMIIAVPACVLLYARREAGLGAVQLGLGVLGPWSVAMAALNLLPLPGLDGREAWMFLPKRQGTSADASTRARGWNKR